MEDKTIKVVTALSIGAVVVGFSYGTFKMGQQGVKRNELIMPVIFGLLSTSLILANLDKIKITKQ